MLDLSWRIPHNIEEFSESAWQLWVEAIAINEGWKKYHTRDSRGSDKGFPDLFIARKGRAVALELKRKGGRVSKEQRAWIEVLSTIPGIEAHILYASHDAAMSVLLMLQQTDAPHS